MDFKELVTKSRSYRGYDESRKVTRQELEELVECARLCPSTTNLQALKFYISCEEEVNSLIGHQVIFGGRIRAQVILPHAGKSPTAYIVICLDKDISTNNQAFAVDTGIAAQTMLLAASEKGLGGIMLGSFSADKLSAAIGLAENLHPMLVLAIGKPDDKIVITDAVNGDIGYTRDENDVHYVPKRSVGELIINK